MPDGSFDIIVAPEPFSDRVEAASVPMGTTIAQLLAVACDAGTLDPQDLSRTDVYINGELLEDRLAALDVTPEPGEVVNIVVMPQGGHGGEKALETALQLAVMVAAFVVAGPGGSLAASLPGLGITGASAAAVEMAAMATINIAGSLALASIFGNLNKPTTTAPTYNLESQSNQARQRECMPLQCGGARVALDVAASAYSTTINNVQYITAIYGCHFGPCTVTDIKIGETLATAYPSTELQIEYFLVPGVARTTALYPNKIDQQSFQNELDPLHADITTETTGVDPCTQFEIDLYWPALFYTSSGGAQEDEQSKVLIQYSPHGANTWLPIPGLSAGTDKSGDAYPAGTFYIVANQRNPIFQTIAFTLPSGQYDIQMSRSIRPGGDTSRDTDDVYWTALRSIDVSEPAIADTTLSVIVLRAMASQDFDGTLGTVTAVVTPIVPVWSAPSNSWLGNPLAIDSNWQASSNAAAIARYMLTGYPAAFPLLASEIDASFGTHAALIDTMGWTGAFTQNSAATQAEVLGKLGKLGRCTYFWNGAAMCAIPDYEKPVPRQVYTGRNARGYSYKRAFPDPLHAVWVAFSNSDEDWKQDGLFVYADGFSAANATLLETLALDYACTATRAYKEGRVYLAKRVLLTETHAWTCGIESVTSFYGDRVTVRHNSTAFGIGEGRVLFRRMSGALVAGVRLDVAVTFEAGLSYAVDVRRSDQVLRGLALTTYAGTTRDLTFATPLVASQAPEAEDLLVIGQVNVVTEDVELIDVTPQADGTAKLTAQAYRWDDIISAETGAVPPLQSLLTTRQATPAPTIVGAQGSPDGVAVAFTVDPQRQSSIKGFAAQYRRSPSEDATSTWTSLALLAPSARVVQTPPIPQAQYQPGDTASQYEVDVQVWTIPTTGEPSQPAQALNILVQQGVYAPTDFEALGVTRTAADGSSYPAIQINTDALTAGSTSTLQIQLQATAPTAATVFTPSSYSPHADNPNGDVTDVLGGVTYTVQGRWHTSDGWNSDWVTQTGVVVPSGALVSSNTSGVGDQTAADVNTTASDLAALAEATLALAFDGNRTADTTRAHTYTFGIQGFLDDEAAAWILDLDTNKLPTGETLGERFAGFDAAFAGNTETIASMNDSFGGSIAAINEQIGEYVDTSGAHAAVLDGLQSDFETQQADYLLEVDTRASAIETITSEIEVLAANTAYNGNMVVDSTFALGGSAWTISNGSRGADASNGKCLLYFATSGIRSFSQITLAQQLVTGIAEGSKYPLQARIYTGGIPDGGLTFVRCTLNWQNGSGASISSHIAFQTNANADWTTFQKDDGTGDGGSPVAPLGATQVLIVLDVASSSGNIHGTGDNIGFEQIKLELATATPALCTVWVDSQAGATLSGQIIENADTQTTATEALSETLDEVSDTVGDLSGTVSTQAEQLVTLNQAIGSLVFMVNEDGTIASISLLAEGGLTPVSVVKITAGIIELDGEVIFDGSVVNAALAAGQVTASFYEWDGTSQPVSYSASPPSSPPTSGGAATGTGGGYTGGSRTGDIP